MRKSSYFNYLWKNERTKLFIVPIVVVLLILAVILIPDFHLFYSSNLAPITGLATVIITFFIWFFQSENNRKESLPKRLTVHYIYDDKIVMSCYEAYLSGVTDIRAWSQQIGRQMNKDGDLKLNPIIEAKTPCMVKSALEKNENKTWKDIMLYEATFFLREPTKDCNKCLIWIIDIDAKKILVAEQNVQQKSPLSVEDAMSLHKLQNGKTIDSDLENSNA